MKNNKVLTYQKVEESSSLTGMLNQELSFVRRTDITSLDRLYLGISGLGPAYRSCTIKDLCEEYGVCHEFIYGLSRMLKKNAGVLFGIKSLPQLTKIAKVLQSIQFAVQGKLETQGSHRGLSNMGKDWGGCYNSNSFISQSLEVAGTLLPSTLKLDNAKHFTFLCDEVYSGEWAILVTIEAQSMAVLDIKLLDKALCAADWEERFRLLESNNILPSELIKDQGKAMASATHVLPSETLILADTFHAVAHRLGLYYGQLHSRLEKAMEKEEQLKGQVARAVSDTMWFKQAEQLEATQLRITDLIDCLEWFEPAYWLILNQLRPFTSQGEVRDKAKAEENIRFGLDILALVDLNGIQKHLKHIRKLLDKGELLGFMDKVPQLYEQWQEQLAPDTLWLWMLYWLNWKKAFQTHNPSVQQQAKEQAQAAQQLLQEYYAQCPHSTDGTFERIRLQLFASLDTIVQASSLVEAFNSILKPFIKSARGQVTQPLLNLVMFFHNHRVFDKRCKRGGKAPIEILTQEQLPNNYIDLIMEIVQQAFEKHQVTSLKQLHAIVCPKDKEKKKRQGKNEQPLNIQQQVDVVELFPTKIPVPLATAS